VRECSGGHGSDVGNKTLSLGERVSRYGDFTSRSVTGEGSLAGVRHHQFPSATSFPVLLGRTNRKARSSAKYEVEETPHPTHAPRESAAAGHPLPYGEGNNAMAVSLPPVDGAEVCAGAIIRSLRILSSKSRPGAGAVHSFFRHVMHRDRDAQNRGEGD